MAENKQDPWALLAVWCGALPGVHQIAKGIARNTVQRMLGFWVLWHLFGGLEGGVSSGVFTVSSAYRQRNEFLAIFGESVDDWNAGFASQIRAAAERGRQ